MHTLSNDGGMVVRVCEVGASLASIVVPDREGRPGEVLLGFDEPDAYLENPAYLGATVGRYAGRIRRGHLPLDGTVHTLPVNLGDHHLHGGPRGFSHRRWETGGVRTGADGTPEITLTLRSPDGDQGYPGAVDAAVTYRLEADNRLRVRFRATSDAPTHLSLTNHAYFNLAGRGDVAGHHLRLYASRYLRLDPEGIPTGDLLPVEGTAWDFTGDKPLFRDRPSYDHCFVLDRWDPTEPAVRESARAREPASGRTLTVSTTLPGVQLYTPDFGEGTQGRHADGYRGREAFCLETQFFPDTPNHPNFPSTRLAPGEVWAHETVFAFGVE